MTAINLTTIKKANEDLLPFPIATSDLSEKNFKFQNGKTMLERYAGEEVITVVFWPDKSTYPKPDNLICSF